MKTIVTLLFVATSFIAFSQNPWKPEEVMPTKELADKITSAKETPIILNVGPMDQIKGAKKIGAVNYADGLKNLTNYLSTADKKKEVVVYCGCCSYDNCPNIRPAFSEAAKLGFKKVRVLDIPEGFKQDWIAKGYPVE